MCTAIALGKLFGRNLDNEFSFEESVAVTPRNYGLKFRLEKTIKNHYAVIGTAYVKDGYPLYYDAANEKGLCMAGLSFYEAKYNENKSDDKYNISPFEFIPFILSQCKNVNEAEKLIKRTNLIKINYSDDLPLTPMHFIISDCSSSIAAEPLNGEIKIYKNELGVLTNSPEFSYQLFALSNFTKLSNENPANFFLSKPILLPYSKGFGAMGLPGDFSSVSRFIKAVFLKESSCTQQCNEISHFFHLLENVSMPCGAVKTNAGFEKTIYSCCFDITSGMYYYKTYNGSRIKAVNMYNEDLEGDSVVSYPMIDEEDIFHQN